MRTERPQHRRRGANPGVDKGKQEIQHFPLPKGKAPKSCPMEGTEEGWGKHYKGKSDLLSRFLCACAMSQPNRKRQGKDKTQAAQRQFLFLGVADGARFSVASLLQGVQHAYSGKPTPAHFRLSSNSGQHGHRSCRFPVANTSW